MLNHSVKTVFTRLTIFLSDSALDSGYDSDFSVAFPLFPIHLTFCLPGFCPIKIFIIVFVFCQFGNLA